MTLLNMCSREKVPGLYSSQTILLQFFGLFHVAQHDAFLSQKLESASGWSLELSQ